MTLIKIHEAKVAAAQSISLKFYLTYSKDTFGAMTATQLLRAYFRSKRPIREVHELDPPLLGPQLRILERTIW